MKKLFAVLLCLLVFQILISSCKKGDNNENNDTSAVVMNNSGEIVSNDIFKLFLYSTLATEDSIYKPNDSLNFHFNEPCMMMQITPYDTITWPKTYTLSFPTPNCNIYDGYIRSGQIIITANKLSKNTGATFTITLNNYAVNGINVSGIKKLTVADVVSGQALAFNDSSVFQISTSNGTFTWNAQHNIQWLLGTSTQSNIADDLFLTMGSASSDLFTSIITDALQSQNYCLWIGSGQVEITPNDLSKRQVIYPDSCVNHANVIINNHY